MTRRSSIEEKIKSYVASEALEGALATEINSFTPLITSGLLDSIAAIRLIGYLEKEFSISIEGWEIDPSRFNTVNRIAEFVDAKLPRELSQ